MTWKYADFQKWIASGREKDVAETVRNLFLYNNQLTTLPDSISDLTNLRKLYLDWNQLTTLPPCLGNMQRLETFWYHNNY